MLTIVSGIGESTKQKFNSLGIFTPFDLIMTFPQKYINLADIGDLSNTENGEYCIAEIVIERIMKPFRRGRLQTFKAYGGANQKKIELLWFNQNYISKVIEVGQSYIFYGKHYINASGVSSLINPIFEKKGVADSQFVCIQPLYRTRGIMSQKVYRKLVNNALSLGLEMPIIIDKTQEKKYKLMPLKDAIYQRHNPSDFSSLEKASKRIRMEQLSKRLAAFQLSKVGKLPYLNTDFISFDVAEEISAEIDFELTVSQKNAINKIVNCLTANSSVMLCGDVGSGKTIVAFAVANFIIKNGYQTAVMAPTEILAVQHFERASKIFGKLGVNVALLTSNTDTATRQLIIEGLSKGKINLVIGTHSLLNDSIEFAKLGLLIVDEQHKFGVAQRTELLSKGESCPVLTLTATPIPRSLQLVAYGEIELITLEKRYQDNIETFIVGKNKRNSMLNYIAKLCEQGKKAVIIAPRIEDSEGIELSSVEQLYKELSKGYFKNLNVDYLHGQMKAEQRVEVFDKFNKNKLSIIIGTSILEVGVDLPDLSIIVIMDAERFGLATLHQIRGRIGRQGQKSMCFLYSESTNHKQMERLSKIKNCNNGMEIAEYDYLIRGAGNIFGTAQVGIGDIGFVDAESLAFAREIVAEMDVEKMRELLQGELLRNNLDIISFT